MPTEHQLGYTATPARQSDEGAFVKGQWLCNCQPRLPAIQFQVKRETNNKGRWFYTCQKDRTRGRAGSPEKCNFFLWAEDARPREEAALFGVGGGGDNLKVPKTPSKRLKQTTLSASVTPRAEGPRGGKTPITPVGELPVVMAGASGGSSATLRASDGSHASAAPGLGANEFGDDMSAGEEEELFRIVDAASSRGSAQQQKPAAVRTGSKRKRTDEDEDEFGDMSSDEERQLAVITDSSSQRQGQSSQQGAKKDTYATPTAAQKHDDTTVFGLPTPALTEKPVRRVLFAEPPEAQQVHSKRQRLDGAGRSTSPTSTPVSSQEERSNPTTPGSGVAGHLYEEGMSAVEGEKLSDTGLGKLKAVLRRHDAKANGLERGRDAARQAHKNEVAKNAKLQEKITDLENQIRAIAEARKKMKSGMMNLWHEV
ncbi:uncharacterized protein BCR38DRAFT_430160 [Pseudomassariella vexata]|uniref:GRF-type domain-containing protein n=1 Tax=Pseudomassariella vexata TaxID=1141098 RepID=A0A1Y2E4N3_9PEZI|nr:uncharacterized protein BCR38DRAFT_430160 [Pseudomassariella vexata]ORY66397.1 hypothetical protein BCR38DRAFT_430160 [Pseudomassariella vexata]